MLSRYVISRIEKNTPSILRIVLKKNEGEPMFSFQPGQYATISYRSYGRPSAERCFSIASSPTEQDTLEFGIRIGGRFTRALEHLEVGDEMNVRGPFGGFIFDAPAQKNVVFCAGGIGITPFISMIRFATFTQLDNKVTLIFSARTQNDIPYYDELKDYASRNPNFRAIYVIGDGEVDKLHDEQYVFKGWVNPDILAVASNNDFTVPTYFLCGPPPFMNSTVNMLSKAGVNKHNIITEAFNQGHQKGNGHGWPFNMYTIGAVGTVAASMMVLAGDMFKTIPKTVLPETLKGESASINSRQQNLDTLVNQLKRKISSNDYSPAVVAADKAVADAKKKIAALSGKSTSSGTKTPTSSGTKTTPASTPTVPKKKCTTSASGVTTCI